MQVGPYNTQATEAIRQLQEVVDGLLTGASSHADCIEELQKRMDMLQRRMDDLKKQQEVQAVTLVRHGTVLTKMTAWSETLMSPEELQDRFEAVDYRLNAVEAETVDKP